MNVLVTFLGTSRYRNKWYQVDSCYLAEMSSFHSLNGKCPPPLLNVLHINEGFSASSSLS